MAARRTERVTEIDHAADPDNLRSIVAGLSDGVVLLHPDGTILWANDAALAMHGVKALDALGGDIAGYRARFELSYRNNHRLDDDEYPTARVVAGETFADVIVEVTAATCEDPGWVHQVRSLVLTGRKGDPDLLVLILQDASQRFQAEDRFEDAFNANPAPAMICRHADLRFIKVNQGFTDMTGYGRDQIIGKTVFEFDIFNGAAHRELAKTRLTEKRAIPQMEAELALPDGAFKLVVVAGQPMELHDEPCMLFTFADLEPRRKAEKALRHSEERFVRAFDLAPVAMVVASLKGHKLFSANRAFQSMTGHADEGLVGRSPGDLTLWDTSATRRRLEGQIEETGALRGADAKVQTKTGELLDCLVSAATITVDDDPCVLWVIQDITERRHSELELVTAIEAVMKDASWFSQSIVEKLANLRSPATATSTKKEVAELTKREKEVLGLVCQGSDDQEIAAGLSMSRNTVRNHVARIYAKIGVNRRGAAIVWARERGLAQTEVKRK